jgi:excisionase family DNA binding protein
MMHDNAWMTKQQAAEHYGVNVKTIERRIADGTLPAYRVGPHVVRLRAADLEQLAQPIPTVAAR